MRVKFDKASRIYGLKVVFLGALEKLRTEYTKCWTVF